MALGVAANTIGKVIASTVFMSCLVHVSISDFFTIRQKRIRRGSTYAECNSGALKECENPHCASATRRLALDNRTYSAQLANSTHTHDVGLH